MNEAELTQAEAFEKRFIPREGSEALPRQTAEAAIDSGDSFQMMFQPIESGEDRQPRIQTLAAFRDRMADLEDDSPEGILKRDMAILKKVHQGYVPRNDDETAAVYSAYGNWFGGIKDATGEFHFGTAFQPGEGAARVRAALDDFWTKGVEVDRMAEASFASEDLRKWARMTADERRAFIEEKAGRGGRWWETTKDTFAGEVGSETELSEEIRGRFGVEHQPGKIQIIGGRPQRTDEKFWLTDNGNRVPNGLLKNGRVLVGEGNDAYEVFVNSAGRIARTYSRNETLDSASANYEQKLFDENKAYRLHLQNLMLKANPAARKMVEMYRESGSSDALLARLANAGKEEQDVVFSVLALQNDAKEGFTGWKPERMVMTTALAAGHLARDAYGMGKRGITELALACRDISSETMDLHARTEIAKARLQNATEWRIAATDSWVDQSLMLIAENAPYMVGSSMKLTQVAGAFSKGANLASIGGRVQTFSKLAAATERTAAAAKLAGYANTLGKGGVAVAKLANTCAMPAVMAMAEAEGNFKAFSESGLDPDLYVPMLFVCALQGAAAVGVERIQFGVADETLSGMLSADVLRKAFMKPGGKFAATATVAGTLAGKSVENFVVEYPWEAFQELAPQWGGALSHQVLEYRKANGSLTGFQPDFNRITAGTGETLSDVFKLTAGMALGFGGFGGAVQTKRFYDQKSQFDTAALTWDEQVRLQQEATVAAQAVLKRSRGEQTEAPVKETESVAREDGLPTPEQAAAFDWLSNEVMTPWLGTITAEGRHALLRKKGFSEEEARGVGRYLSFVDQHRAQALAGIDAAIPFEEEALTETLKTRFGNLGIEGSVKVIAENQAELTLLRDGHALKVGIVRGDADLAARYGEGSEAWVQEVERLEREKGNADFAWGALSAEEQAAVKSRYNGQTNGFYIRNTDGIRDDLNLYDGLIWLGTGEDGSGIARQSTLRHEVFHALMHLSEQSGELTAERIETLAGRFGEETRPDGSRWFNEEKAAAFWEKYSRALLNGEFDESSTEGVFGKLAAFFRKIVNFIRGKQESGAFASESVDLDHFEKQYTAVQEALRATQSDVEITAVEKERVTLDDLVVAESEQQEEAPLTDADVAARENDLVEEHRAALDAEAEARRHADGEDTLRGVATRERTHREADHAYIRARDAREQAELALEAALHNETGATQRAQLKRTVTRLKDDEAAARRALARFDRSVARELAIEGENERHRQAVKKITQEAEKSERETKGRSLVDFAEPGSLLWEIAGNSKIKPLSQDVKAFMRDYGIKSRTRAEALLREKQSRRAGEYDDAITLADVGRKTYDALFAKEGGVSPDELATHYADLIRSVTGTTAPTASDFWQALRVSIESAKKTRASAFGAGEAASLMRDEENHHEAVLRDLTQSPVFYQLSSGDALDTPEMAAVRKLYTNRDGSMKPGWLKAPNGEPSKLNERQWLQVRTPPFINYFGDWLTLAKIRVVQAIEAKAYEKGEPVTKAEAKAIFESFGVIENIEGDATVFPNSTIGKILRHKGFPSGTILRHLGELYRTALHAYNKTEEDLGVRPDGTTHKSHPNFLGYKNFVNKFIIENEVDGELKAETYYIRFTVQETAPSKKKPSDPNHVFHSTFISSIALYKEGATLSSSRNIDLADGFAPSHDDRLAQWFDSVNPAEVSKIIDENGEPLVVYHGTNAEFWTFDKNKALDKRGRTLGLGWGKGKFYFTISEQAAAMNGKRVIPAFLNVRNPFSSDEYEAGKEPGTRHDASIAAMDKRLLKEGYDGISGLDVSGGIAVYEPTQIKSATDNIGTFDATNSDIRYQMRRMTDEELITSLASAAAGIVIENKLAGHGLDMGDAETRLLKTAKGTGLSDEQANAALARAGEIVAALQNRITDPSKNGVMKAIRSHNEGMEYDRAMREGFAEGFITGRTTAGAERLIEEAKREQEKAALRDAMGYTPDELAQMTGFDPIETMLLFSEIARVERGEKKATEKKDEGEPSVETVEQTVPMPAEMSSSLKIAVERAKQEAAAIRKRRDKKQKKDGEDNEAVSPPGRASQENHVDYNEMEEAVDEFEDGGTMALALIETEAVALDNGLVYAALFRRFMGERLAEKYGLPADRVWKDARVRQDYARTASATIAQAAKKLAYGRVRESLVRCSERLKLTTNPYTVTLVLESASESLFKALSEQTGRELCVQIKKWLKKMAQAGSRVVQGKEDFKRTVDGEVQAYVKNVVEVMFWGQERVEKRKKEIKDALEKESFSDENQNLGDIPVVSDENVTLRVHKLIRELDVLEIYGSLQNSPHGEIADKFDMLQWDVLENRAKHEAMMLKRDAETKAFADVYVKDALARSKGKHRVKEDGALKDLLTGASVPDLFTQLRWPLSVGGKAEELINDLERRFAHANRTMQVGLERGCTEFYKAVTQIYRKNAHAVLDELMRPDKRYDDLSRANYEVTEASPTFQFDEKTKLKRAVKVEGKKTNLLSKANLMQIYLHLSQQDTAKNAAIYGRDAAYLQRIENELTAQDMAMIQWLRDFYQRYRVGLSTVSKAITGFPVWAPATGYAPIQWARAAIGLPAEAHAFSLFPGFLNNRVQHGLDLDETAHPFALFIDRLNQGEHYKAFAELGIYVRGTLGRGKVTQTLVDVRGKNRTQEIRKHLLDALTGGKSTGGIDKMTNNLRSWATMSVLFYNPFSALKQVEGTTAWALDYGWVGTAKGFATALTPAGLRAIGELINSDVMQARLGEGATDEMRNLINTAQRLGMGPARRLFETYRAHGMDLTKFMDAFSCLLIGQSFYRDRVEQYSRSMPIEEAKLRALDDLDVTIQRTQQSSRPEYLNFIQRRGGVGKLLVMFSGPAFVRLGLEIEAAHNAWREKGGKGTLRDLASKLVTLHVVCPAIYYTLSFLLSSLLRPDDPDWERYWNGLFTSMVLGPFSGMFIWGTVAADAVEAAISGKSFNGSDMAPPAVQIMMQQIGRSAKVLKDVAPCLKGEDVDMEKVREDIDRLFDGTSAPWRIGSGLIEKHAQ